MSPKKKTFFQHISTDYCDYIKIPRCLDNRIDKMLLRDEGDSDSNLEMISFVINSFYSVLKMLININNIRLCC